MNNQYDQNDLNNNMNNNLNNQQPMNNQQGNPAMQGFQQPVQQPMYNQQPVQQQQKKKNIALIIGLSIVGIFILGIVALFITFSIEEKQDKPWKSGQVQILGKNIQLPCDVDTFESTLNTKIIDGEFSEEIKDVKIRLGYKSVLIFDVYVDDDMVTGIMLNAYESDEDELFKIDPYASYASETERDTALNVIFPGNVNIETPVKEIKKLYSTKPFNGSYTYFEEEIGKEPPFEISAHHKYQNSDWSIEIHTMDGEITGIDYYYLNN